MAKNSISKKQKKDIEKFKDVVIHSKIYKKGVISLKKRFLKTYNLKEGDEIVITGKAIIKYGEFVALLMSGDPDLQKQILKNKHHFIMEAKIYKNNKITLKKYILEKYNLKEGDEIVMLINDAMTANDFQKFVTSTLEEVTEEVTEVFKTMDEVFGLKRRKKTKTQK